MAEQNKKSFLRPDIVQRSARHAENTEVPSVS